MNSAASTSVVATMGPVTWLIVFSVASAMERPSSCITRCAFSATMIASSTTRLMARTIAKRVIVLAE